MSVVQVDRVELELAVLVGRSPEELVGTCVELTALSVIPVLAVGNLDARRTFLRLSTCRTVNLVEVAFLADTIGETVIGDTQCHIGVLGRSDGGTRQGGVVYDTPLKILQVGGVEFSEHLSRRRVSSRFSSDQTVVSDALGLFFQLPGLCVECIMREQENTIRSITRIEVYAVKHSVYHSASAIEIAFLVVGEQFKIEVCHRVERIHAHEAVGEKISPHGQIRIDRHQILRCCGPDSEVRTAERRIDVSWQRFRQQCRESLQRVNLLLSRLLSRQDSGRDQRHIFYWHHLCGCGQHSHRCGKSCN